MESVWESAVGEHERAAHAARTWRVCEEGMGSVCVCVCVCVTGSTCCTMAAAKGDDREQAACRGVTFFALRCSSSRLSASGTAFKSAGKPENADEMPTLMAVCYAKRA